MKLDKRLCVALTRVFPCQGETLFVVLLAAFKLLLRRYTGQEDILVGTILIESLWETNCSLGTRCVKPLVLRTDLAGDPRATELVARVSRTVENAVQNRDYPYEELVESFARTDDSSKSPVFRVMFVQGSVPSEISGTSSSGGRQTPIEPFLAVCDLVLLTSEAAGGLSVRCEYDPGLFDPTTIKRLLGHLRVLLEEMASKPEQRVSALPLLTEAERQLLLVEWNATRVDYPQDACLHRFFEAQVEESPDSVALVFEGGQLTYRELNRRSNQLAHHLHRLGVGPEVLVGVFMERCVEMVVALYGILKAGGAYVPLDPEHPPERIAFMVSDTKVPVLLAQRHLVERLPEQAARVICLDSEWEIIAGESDANLADGARAENLAYVIYTSGSTGKPKGVMNTHRGICNRLLWMQDEYHLEAHDRVLQKTPFSFDVSVWEFFWPLLNGACLVIARPAGHRDSAYLRATIVEQHITTLHFVPSMLRVFLKELGREDSTALKRVICSGEALSFDLHQRFFSRLAAQLHNLYGPTEAAVDVTFWACDRHSKHPTVPIGRPVANTRIYILDDWLQPVPVGIAGELHIGGVQVARGYLNRPDLTAEKFIPDPFSVDPSARLYKTGDVARYLPDGNIEYLGRFDFQVKLRGFRIELDEIEAALLQHPAVQEAVVLALEAAPNDKRLVAYLVLDGRASPPSITSLRSFLLQILPEYMVPSAFITLPAMPLTPNGKLDRKALPAPDAFRPDLAGDYTPPRTPLEEFLVTLWEVVLGIEGVGITDNFFELGGNSIQGMFIVNRLKQTLSEYVYIVALFEAPNIADLAAYLVAHYPKGVSRVFGADALQAIESNKRTGATGESEQVDAAKVARFRHLLSASTIRGPCKETTPKNPRAIFILAPPRSGSTLLRVMLAGHSCLFAPQELELLSFDTLADMQAALAGKYSFWLEGVLRTIMEIKQCNAEKARSILDDYASKNMTSKQCYRLLQEWVGERTLVDKTPSYTLDLGILERIETDFDEALYIHLLRHPYGMIHSFEQVKLDQVFFRGEHDFSVRQLAELIWLVSHENIIEFLRSVPEQRQCRVRFEDLVATPKETMERICDFAGLQLQQDMLHPYKDMNKKMTDGIHDLSIMRGDPKFQQYREIDSGVADRWKESHHEDFLGDITWKIAESLGYVKESSTTPINLPNKT
jgi:amino acid adenylation domain-containing protein